MLSRRAIRLFLAVFLFVHAYGIRIASFAATGSVLTIKQTQIEFFLGVDDGIYTDQELYILRNKKLLGKISVTFVLMPSLVSIRVALRPSMVMGTLITMFL